MREQSRGPSVDGPDARKTGWTSQTGEGRTSLKVKHEADREHRNSLKDQQETSSASLKNDVKTSDVSKASLEDSNIGKTTLDDSGETGGPERQLALEDSSPGWCRLHCRAGWCQVDMHLMPRSLAACQQGLSTWDQELVSEDLVPSEDLFPLLARLTTGTRIRLCYDHWLETRGRCQPYHQLVIRSWSQLGSGSSQVFAKTGAYFLGALSPRCLGKKVFRVRKLVILVAETDRWITGSEEELGHLLANFCADWRLVEWEAGCRPVCWWLAWWRIAGWGEGMLVVIMLKASRPEASQPECKVETSS